MVMKETLESKAAPKHEEAIKETRVTNVLLRELIVESRILNCTESKRLDLDVISHDLVISYRKKASRATWMQVFIGVAALGIAMIALYSGAVDINKDNPVVIMITEAVKSAKGYF